MRLFAALLFLASAILAQGAMPPFAHAKSEPERKGVQGRPSVFLDRLELARAPLAVGHEDALREILAREARHVDWGAGRGARITYRFRIDDLQAVEESGVLRVTCSATGWLPKGKVAKSRLTFGGAPKEQKELVRHVLTIVARGVLTRLAEMERRRRTE